jgi:integral membrane protein (TIGR01906 family)
VRTSPARVAASVLIAVATAIVILAVAILPFLNPLWVSFEQDRTATSGTGPTTWSDADTRMATSAILGDLLLWRGNFEVEVRGEPVLSAAERGHMLDVRRVFALFGIVAVVSAVGLVAAHRRVDRRAFWQAVRAGSLAVAGAVVAIGLLALVAFDALFELFHRVLFAGGNYTFDPSTDRLVQLFPYRFWVETAFAVGAAIVGIGVLAAWLAGRRRSEPVDRLTVPRRQPEAAR